MRATLINLVLASSVLSSLNIVIIITIIIIIIACFLFVKFSILRLLFSSMHVNPIYTVLVSLTPTPDPQHT